MALRLASRQLASLLPASRSGLCAFSTEQAQSKGKDEEESKPTYTYMSPGSSMRDPGYALGHSLGSPAYEIDHKATRFAPPHQRKQPIPTEKPSQQQAAPGSPTYVYATPGSSLREASYGISINDPVYVVDPKPTQPKQAPTQPKQAATQQSKAAQTNQQAVSPAPPASKVRVGLKPDDFANQPYVTSPKGSMREPHYVSVSDPQDAPHLKK